MTQTALLHALGAACMLRQELEHEAPCPRRLEDATAELMERAEFLLNDRECSAALVLVYHTIGTLARSAFPAMDHALIRAARHALLELIAHIWTAQEARRRARYAETMSASNA